MNFLAGCVVVLPTISIARIRGFTMSSPRMIALSAAVLAAVGCSAQTAGPPPAITQTVTPQSRATTSATLPQQPVPASPSPSPPVDLPKPTATTDIGPRPRPKICDRRGEHRVPAPGVLSISGISVDGDRVVLKARPSIRVCGPKVANDGYYMASSGPARTYRLARRATVILVDMSNGPVPAHYSVAAFIKLLRATPELNIERGGLDPHFRSFETASVDLSDSTEITTLSQHYHP
ncbi:hypothetical protein HII36_53590 [Nonomuraea sp. NN258]|uniref:hypothetical protein n=1 Tax=Nonomuraea antri TaxID=2730852 RepID=UPI001569224F|nr:hypothetical protein [Nonomuraea antri]NRQ40587.1 hypothetical protein [Nonomuraea antri]